MLSIADCYQIARQMIRPALRTMHMDYASAQDQEDFAQEGAFEAWKAQAAGHTEIAYLCGAARRAIVRFIAMQWAGSSQYAQAWGGRDDEAEEIAAPEIELRRGLPEVITRRLWKRLADERGASPRAQAACERDVALAYLISKGYKSSAIALELGQSPANIRRYRVELRRRLARWQQEEPNPHATPTHTPTPADRLA